MYIFLHIWNLNLYGCWLIKSTHLFNRVMANDGMGLDPIFLKKVEIVYTNYGFLNDCVCILVKR